jgi:hypothetical protein
VAQDTSATQVQAAASQTWAQPTPSHAPSVRMSAATAYDSLRRRRATTSAEPGGAGLRRPAHLVTIAFDRALVPATAVSALDVVVSAGGTGYDDGGMAIDGTTVEAWNDSTKTWQGLSTNGAPAASPGLLPPGTIQGAGARALICGDNTIHLRIRPTAMNGASANLAAVSTDYVSVRVGYAR